MFFSSEHHEHEYNELKKRQLFVWVFLAVVVLMIGGILLFVVYGVMSGGVGTPASFTPAGVNPSPKPTVSAMSTASKSKGDYFLMGELYKGDKKYRIYKVYYAPFAKEEFFALPWNNTAIVPAVAQYGDYTAVFSDPGTGIFIGKNGKVASTNETAFFPPYVYFSTSPDGKKMVYFRYLSSVGTTSLTVHDMEKNEDIFSWAVGSSASEPCEFHGWSSDGTKAYCTNVSRGIATLKAIDIQRYSAATIASVSGARSAEYYPEFDTFVVAGRDGISVRAVSKGTKQIIDSPEAKVATQAMLAGNGKQVVFTAKNIIYIADIETKEQRPLHEGILVDITPDSQKILFRESVDEEMTGDHYSTMLLDGGDHKNFHTVMNTVSLSQFLGWFSE